MCDIISEVYSTSTVAKKLSLTLHYLYSLHQHDYVSPSYPTGTSSDESYYTFNNVCCILLWGSLIKTGLKPSLAAEIIKKTADKDFTTFTIIRHRSVFMFMQVHLAGVGLTAKRLLK